MALPNKLRKFNLFNNGNSYLGLIEEVTLPKLGWKTEEYDGAGQVAPVDIPLSLEKLEMEMTLGGLVVGVMKQFGTIGLADVPLRFNGSYQEAQGSAIKAVEVNVRGFHRQIDPGNAKQGDNTQHKISTSLSYYKLTIDGEDIIEIDALNQVFIVDGKDLYADHRQAMGL